jgi:Holliday junction DNA helicase RuvA
MPADDMITAIRGNDVGKLTRIPGIGKKTAERMVLELRDKLPQLTQVASARPVSPVEDDVLSALVNLGYQRPVAERALATVSGNGKAASFDSLFREALAALSK